MSDSDLIRRSAVRELLQQCDLMGNHPSDPLAVMLNEIPAAQPTVKPLAWLDSQQGRYSESRAIGILYSIRLGSDGVTRWQAGHMGPWHEVASIEAAKAAAQADYEARILSALDMQPTVSPDVAALVEAAEKVRDSYWYSSDGIITGIYDLEAALARVKG